MCAHQVPSSKATCYDISGIYGSPAISIRDQILRAALIIEKAIKVKIINARTDEKAKPLLVVGGGFAGVVAAVKAAQQNIPTFLTEIEETVLNRFLESQRIVSPSQYDFPHSHWVENKFPWNKSKIIPQISWQKEEILATAVSFVKELNSTRNNGYPLFITKNTICKIIGNFSEGKSSLIQAEFTPKKNFEIDGKFQSEIAKYPRGFGMLLSCLGVGNEFVSSAKDYKSYDFWALNADDFRKKELPTLIVGAGDGGLQDFLLLSTRLDSVGEIYEKVAVAFPASMKYKIEREILRANDVRCREELWHGDDKRFKCETYTKNHKIIVALVNELFKADKTNSTVLALKPIISEAFEKNLIFLAYSCKHFNQCYPLNHFLVLLLDRFRKFYGKESFLLPNTKVTEITGKTHDCHANPFDCENKEHLIRYVRKSCRREEKSSAILDFEPQLILLRFGINNKAKTQDVANFYIYIENISKKIQLMSGSRILPYTLP